jgi:hypothetical protein
METKIFNKNNIESIVLKLDLCLNITNNKNILIIDKKYDINNISDTNIIKMLQYKYFNYGIIYKDLIQSDILNEKYYYKETLTKKSIIYLNNNILSESDFIIKVNTYLIYCNNYINLINDNKIKINKLESLILDKYNYLRINDKKNFILKFKKINQLLEVINTILYNLYNDFNYNYFKLLEFKYFTLINENNIEIMYNNFLKITQLYKQNNINFFFISDDNTTVYFKILDGLFDIDLLYNLVNNDIQNNFSQLSINFM